MRDVYDFPRAFIITDANLYQIGACDKIIAQLNDMGIRTAEFFDIRVDPQIQDAMKGLPKMHEFEPDVIIAVGGGSAIDTAKDHVDHATKTLKKRSSTWLRILLDIEKENQIVPSDGQEG